MAEFSQTLHCYLSQHVTLTYFILSYQTMNVKSSWYAYSYSHWIILAWKKSFISNITSTKPPSSCV